MDDLLDEDALAAAVRRRRKAMVAQEQPPPPAEWRVTRAEDNSFAGFTAPVEEPFRPWQPSADENGKFTGYSLIRDVTIKREGETASGIALGKQVFPLQRDDGQRISSVTMAGATFNIKRDQDGRFTGIEEI